MPASSLFKLVMAVPIFIEIDENKAASNFRATTWQVFFETPFFDENGPLRSCLAGLAVAWKLSIEDI